MLFTKKIKFSVTERQTKEELLSESGEVLLRINLRYPEINCAKRDPLSRNAAGLYKRLADGLASYARNDLIKTAKKAKESSGEDFMPYSVVMRWENTYESEKYLSILIEISISDGKGEPMYERKTQVWERKFGTKCRFSEFFDTKDTPRLVEEYIGVEHKKRFERELFTVRENGFEFYIRDGGGYFPKVIPFTECVSKGLFDSIE